jgi:hypothetical protein
VRSNPDEATETRKISDPVEIEPPVDHRRNKDEESGSSKPRRGRAPVIRSKQDPLREHQIYEDQLKTLLSLRRDRYSDTRAISIGVAASFAEPVFDLLCQYVEYIHKGMPMIISPEKLLDSVIFGVSVATIIITGVIIKQNDNNADNLANTIRGQVAE